MAEEIYQFFKSRQINFDKQEFIKFHFFVFKLLALK